MPSGLVRLGPGGQSDRGLGTGPCGGGAAAGSEALADPGRLNLVLAAASVVSAFAGIIKIDLASGPRRVRARGAARGF